MIIGALLRNNIEARVFVNDTHRRLKKNYFLDGGAFYMEDENRLKCFFGLKPIIPSLFFLALYVLILGMVFYFAFGWSPVAYLFVSIFLFSTDYFRSPKFTFKILKKGLLKSGYIGIIVPLTDSDVWEVLENGSKRS